MEVEAASTIDTVKAKILDKEVSPLNQQCPIFAGIHLEGGVTPSDPDPLQVMLACGQSASEHAITLDMKANGTSDIAKAKFKGTDEASLDQHPIRAGRQPEGVMIPPGPDPLQVISSCGQPVSKKTIALDMVAGSAIDIAKADEEHDVRGRQIDAQIDQVLELLAQIERGRKEDELLLSTAR